MGLLIRAGGDYYLGADGRKIYGVVLPFDCERKKETRYCNLRAEILGDIE